MPKIERVLISVTDKTGVAEFARGLTAFGVEIVSTGGTARLLREAGLAVRDVAEVTGFPEMLDGRVKTIHPKIAGGVLAIRANAGAHAGAGRARHRDHRHGGGQPLRLREGGRQGRARTSDELIENIDIGGPTLIRASAKNYQDVAVVTSPSDYPAVLEEMTGERRLALARDPLASGQEGLRASRPPTTAPSRPAWRGSRSPRSSSWTSRPPCCPPSSKFAPRARFRCATARTRISRPRSTRTAPAASPAQRNSTARSFPTTTWWTSTPPGTWSASLTRPRPRSSSTPTPAAAPSRPACPRPTAKRSSATRSRRMAACWPSTARSTRKPRAKPAKRSWSALPRRTIPPRRSHS